MAKELNETDIRQLKRTLPLETKTIDYNGQKLTIPTESEI
jgi:hypothetical protein